MPTFCRAWEAEPNEALKASILLNASKQLKNKDLLDLVKLDLSKHMLSTLIPTMMIAIILKIILISTLAQSINTVNHFFMVMMLMSMTIHNPDSVLIANTASNSSSKASKSKEKQSKSIFLLKTKKTQIPPAGPLQLLTNSKDVLCDENGILWGYLHHTTPKMIESDKEANAAARSSLRSCIVKTAQFTYHTNMASMTAALADFQDTI